MMIARSHRRVCLFPHLTGVSGMATFQGKMAAGLEARGIEAVFGASANPCDAILVVGGTRQVGTLWKARRQGIPVVQRLDGMNWIHRVRNTGIRHYLRAEYGNALLSLIRSRLASRVVYQSQFAREWWERTYGPTPVDWSVVYNGVDLSVFSPGKRQALQANRVRMLVIEASLRGGYELGLENAVELAITLPMRGHKHDGSPRVELVVAGRVDERVRRRMEKVDGVEIEWAGVVPHDRVPAIHRSAHFLFSADINAACPNTVIEAMACGTPVVGFETGALPELLDGKGGKLAAYGGDAWRLDPPDIPALAEAAYEVLSDIRSYQGGARQRAEAAFGLDKMVEGYLQAIFE